MNKILTKKALNPTVVLMEVEAPLIAKKAQPGQFIILRVDEEGERIPLTIADYNVERGSITIIFQIVGGTTELLNSKNEGDYILDFVGPLGKPTDLDGLKDVCIVGGGVGCAIALPIAKKLHELGANVHSIIGFRNKDLVILEDEFKKCSTTLKVMTDDGSYGEKGNVCMPLNASFESGKSFDKIIAIGPLVMMKFVTLAAKPTNIPCEVSMNPVMIDGTGMCGGCRISLVKDGKRFVKFACVDGPDFNGYEVDFDDAMTRSVMYKEHEIKNHEKVCNLLKKADNYNG